MAYIVAEPCVKCKYTDCVDVCPVSCFYEADNFLVINPDECIDCGACESECPVNAIFEQDDLPDKWKAWIDINAVFSGAKSPGEVKATDLPPNFAPALGPNFKKLPNIPQKKGTGFPDAKEWEKKEGKITEANPFPPAGK